MEISLEVLWLHMSAEAADSSMLDAFLGCLLCFGLPCYIGDPQNKRYVK